MVRQEIPHHTPEQIRDYIERGLELVTLLDPPEDLRATVLNQAIALLSGKNIVMAQPQPVDLAGLAIPGRRH